MIQDKSIEALGYWTIGLEYLHSVKSVLQETIKAGNQHVVVAPAIKGEAFSWNSYEERTQWSDFNMIIPSLFNLYHGLETILKGFLIAGGCLVRKKHKLSKLLSEFEIIHHDHCLANIAGKYINQDRLPPIIAAFCLESNISIDEYYQALKYPESNSGKVYKHRPLKYHGESGILFFTELVDDIDQINRSTVTLGRSIYPNI